MRYAVLILALLVLFWQKTVAQQPAADKWKTVNAFSIGDKKQVHRPANVLE